MFQAFGIALGFRAYLGSEICHGFTSLTEAEGLDLNITSGKCSEIRPRGFFSLHDRISTSNCGQSF